MFAIARFPQRLFFSTAPRVFRPSNVNAQTSDSSSSSSSSSQTQKPEDIFSANGSAETRSLEQLGSGQVNAPEHSHFSAASWRRVECRDTEGTGEEEGGAAKVEGHGEMGEEKGFVKL